MLKETVVRRVGTSSVHRDLVFRKLRADMRAREGMDISCKQCLRARIHESCVVYMAREGVEGQGILQTYRTG